MLLLSYFPPGLHFFFFNWSMLKTICSHARCKTPKIKPDLLVQCSTRFNISSCDFFYLVLCAHELTKEGLIIYIIPSLDSSCLSFMSHFLKTNASDWFPSWSKTIWLSKDNKNVIFFSFACVKFFHGGLSLIWSVCRDDRRMTICRLHAKPNLSIFTLQGLTTQLCQPSTVEHVLQSPWQELTSAIIILIFWWIGVFLAHTI